MVERAAAADMSSRIFKAALNNGRFASRESFRFIVVFISGPSKSRTHAQAIRRRRLAGTGQGDCGLHGDWRRERDFCKRRGGMNNEDAKARRAVLGRNIQRSTCFVETYRR